jgi:hypothetical protein
MENITLIDSNNMELLIDKNLDNIYKSTNLKMRTDLPQDNSLIIERNAISSSYNNNTTTTTINNNNNIIGSIKTCNYPLATFYWPFIYLSMNINNENVFNIDRNEKILWTLFQLYGTKIDTTSMTSSYIRSSSIIRILIDTKCIKLSSFITTFSLEAYLRKNPFVIPNKNNDLISPRFRSNSRSSAATPINGTSNSKRSSFSDDKLLKLSSGNNIAKGNMNTQLKSDGIKLIGFGHFQFILQSCIPTIISKDKNHKGDKNVHIIYDKLIEKFSKWISNSSLNKEYSQLLKDSLLCISGIMLPNCFSFDHTVKLVIFINIYYLSFLINIIFFI